MALNSPLLLASAVVAARRVKPQKTPIINIKKKKKKKRNKNKKRKKKKKKKKQVSGSIWGQEFIVV
jgi:uncharacterized membrane protein affecting hemolysin expression